MSTPCMQAARLLGLCRAVMDGIDALKCSCEETTYGITAVPLSYIPVDGHTPQSEVQTAEVPEAAALMQVAGARVLMEDTRETQDGRITTVNTADRRCCMIAVAAAALAVGLGAPATKDQQVTSEEPCQPSKARPVCV